jgi:hypothetical protein
MADEDQVLFTHTMKGKNKKEHYLPKKFKMGQRDNSKIRCHYCQELGHFVRDCPLIMEIKNKKGSKRHQAHTAEDDEPPKKVEKKYESSDEDYVLISALIGNVTHGSDTWLIDNGDSKHMIGYEDSLSKLIHKYSPHKVKLGDDYQYPIKGVGEASYKLHSRKTMKMKEVLYVPGLKKNLLSNSSLDKKGFRASFIDGQFIMWPRGKTLENTLVIGAEEGGLYKLKGHSNSTMVHDIVNPSELWHRIFSHLHYKSLLVVRKMVTSLPEIQAELDGVCKECAQGKNVKHSFPNSDSRAKGFLDIVHSDIFGPMSTTSLSGYVYYVSFIDDYSRKTWIYLLKEKNEVFGKFKEFKDLVENLTERKINTLRSDNGREFTSE